MIASAILGEIGDIKRFPNVPSLIAYAGLDPTTFESGSSITKHRKLSKKGSKYLRTALWQGTVYSLVHNPNLKAFYDKKLSEGKPKQVALGAVTNKLTRIIYGILRSGQDYQLDFSYIQYLVKVLNLYSLNWSKLLVSFLVLILLSIFDT